MPVSVSIFSNTDRVYPVVFSTQVAQGILGIFKGKARVSPMANKKVKTLLHLAALVAIQHDPELRAYYDRKVNDEKKNKMTVINAVRNKLVLRVFACVKQERKYEKNYAKSVA